MTCDRCSYCDNEFRFGTDEHGVDCGWQTLCERCRRDVLDGMALARELAQPADSRRDAGRPPARDTRRGTGPIDVGHPRYRDCYPSEGEPWRRAG